jgi:hypothetical protein
VRRTALVQVRSLARDLLHTVTESVGWLCLTSTPQLGGGNQGRHSSDASRAEAALNSVHGTSMPQSVLTYNTIPEISLPNLVARSSLHRVHHTRLQASSHGGASFAVVPTRTADKHVTCTLSGKVNSLYCIPFVSIHLHCMSMEVTDLITHMHTHSLHSSLDVRWLRRARCTRDVSTPPTFSTNQIHSQRSFRFLSRMTCTVTFIAADVTSELASSPVQSVTECVTAARVNH